MACRKPSIHANLQKIIKQNFCDKINIPCLVFNNLKETVEKAKQISLSGEIVLFSPACASWDQYKCFEDRGTEFKTIVNNLK